MFNKPTKDLLSIKVCSETCALTHYVLSRHQNKVTLLSWPELLTAKGNLSLWSLFSKLIIKYPNWYCIKLNMVALAFISVTLLGERKCIWYSPIIMVVNKQYLFDRKCQVYQKYGSVRLLEGYTALSVKSS